MDPLNTFEVLNKTGLTISNYHLLMGLSGVLCGFIFVFIILIFISNIQ